MKKFRVVLDINFTDEEFEEAMFLYDNDVKKIEELLRENFADELDAEVVEAGFYNEEVCC